MSSSDSLLTPSNYNQSSTLPHSASKHGSAKPKKHKKRPGNIVIDDSNVPNYITFHTRQGASLESYCFSKIECNLMIGLFKTWSIVTQLK